MRDGQTEPWKEPPSVSINRTYLNSNTNLKTTEEKTLTEHPRAENAWICITHAQSSKEESKRKNKQGPKEIFENVVISQLTQ